MSATPTDTDTPTDERPVEVLDSPLEALSPTEVHLESLRKKLETQQSTAKRKIEEAEKKLINARTRIDEVREQIAVLETETLDARDTMNQAMGLAYALQRTVKELRQEETGETEGGGVGELRMLVEAEDQRARELAVTLVGDSPYTDEFLTNTTIDEGRAGGLVFQIKNDHRQKVAERIASVTNALQARVPRSHSEYEKRERAYQEAEDHYRNASADLANAEYRRDSLLEQAKHSLSTIAALNEAVAKADRVAVRIEEQGKQHEEEDLSKANDILDKKTADTMRAKAELAEAELDEKTLEGLLAEYIKQEAHLKKTIRKVSDLPGIVSPAVDLSRQAPHQLGRPLLRVKSNLDDAVSKATADLDTAVVQIAPPLHEKISNAVAYGAAYADSAFAALEKAMERLQELLKRFDDDVAMADMKETDSLDWVAMERMLQCGEELDHFLKNEWKRLSVGTPEGVYEIVDRTRSDVEKALEPLLAVLRRGEAALPASLAPATAPAAPAPDELTKPEKATTSNVITDTADNMAPTLEESLTVDAAEATKTEAGRAQSAAVLKEVLAGAAAQVATPPAMAAEEQQKEPAEAAADAEAADLTSEPTRIGVAPTTSPQEAARPSPRRRRGVVEE